VTTVEGVGREITPAMVQATHELFAPLHRDRAYQASKIDRDLVYGPHERHRLDIHTVENTDPRMVLLFVHGGGFVGGDKNVPGMPYYDHLGGWAVEHGMVGVTMTYRLAPDHQWPAGADDVADAIAWVREHIGDHGGDPARIVLMGHSAGAAHVASCLGRGEEGVAAAVLLSGLYDLASAKPTERLAAYFGADADRYAQRSPLPGLLASPVPLLFGVAEWDPPEFHRQATTVTAEFVAERGAMPPLIWVQGHNHISEILSLGLDDTLSAPLHRFLASRAGASTGAR
jgi:acetyl esterase/lipase